MQAYNNTKDFRDANQEATEKNSLTGRVKEQTGWDGEEIDNKNGTEIIDQSTNTLKENGLPGKTGACIFLSTVDGTAIALDVELTAKEKAEVYKIAKENGAVGKGDSAYWVNDYDLIAKAVAQVKGVDAENIKVSGAKLVNPNDDISKVNATTKIVNTLNNGGAIDIRFDKDPGITKSNAHTMSVTGASVDNSGNTILHVNDTNHPDVATYVNTSTMTLYTEDDDGKKTPSKRPILNYRTITNNQGEN